VIYAFGFAFKTGFDTSPAGVLSLHGDLKISFDCDTEAVELAATNQVPNAMMDIYTASKKLAPSELDIPE
jgi:hypothetical protein